ncbi:hypothetical protein BCV69DRAFT_295811 [Microstroma glucosiphilum]|uniref:Uncharacterized protein n=1 Tax=Pseudomicrostroma glucosiphilum TaxID=1684307 RepID=A0A316UJT0_9BASI|nr:hypothetical protein BCV69DRAFT_295811 [Pseudomicrostroma glucosiphilum]PWN23475.1 hypothetical protein BCV69DRAFT_295811 [Pseudomicrostroma glucosiphilum]
MVRIAAFSLIALVAMTGFAAAGSGHHYDCNKCQLTARSDKALTKKDGLKCVKQLAGHITDFYKGSSKTEYKLIKHKALKIQTDQGEHDIVKGVDFKDLQFHPDSVGGFTIRNFECENNLEGLAICSKCEKH